MTRQEWLERFERAIWAAGRMQSEAAAEVSTLSGQDVDGYIANDDAPEDIALAHVANMEDDS